MTEFNNLTGLRHSEQLVVERTVRELDLRKRESGGAERAESTQF